ncbi:MAG: tripartite tricarboxylate transporter substrate binding protein [Ottowia sp.]|uniref:Bug family tripartite tricarboxylate transporter substrate binding protein n=1 Tax=Ottowia sp. TaxID=1898956 RepID=UPI003C7191E6
MKAIRFLVSCLIMLVITQPLSALAQWKPQHPMRLIVPFAPGAATDISARAVSGGLASLLGQPVVVENQPAGSGTVGTEAGAKALPDGHVLTLAHDPPFVLLPHVRKLNYDPLKDFEFIGMIASIPLVLVARPDLSANNIRELIEAAKAQPGKLTIASSGTGAAAHLAAELFKHETQTKILHVPYRGSAQAITDVIGGQVDMVFSSFGPAIEHIRAGKLKPLGVSIQRRHALLPNIPSISETVPGFEYTVWTGIAVPAATPKEIRDQTSAALVKVLQQPGVRERLDKLGFVPGEGTPQQLKKQVINDFAKWQRVIQAARIELE